jgi:molecular chaperone HscB
MVTNYFDFYKLPISFNVDEAVLKRIFYANSKQFHPDFFTLDSAEKQAEILELSTLNTEAYKTLSDFEKRMKYILDLKGVMGKEGENKLPQDFLMDMMDINEALIELEMDYDEAAHQKVLLEVQTIENQLFMEVEDILEGYQEGVTQLSELEEVKNFYLKKRYLLRIRENLSKFAPL